MDSKDDASIADSRIPRGTEERVGSGEIPEHRRPDYDEIGRSDGELREISDRLREWGTRQQPLDDDTVNRLARRKETAVACGDQGCAGAAWCYEQILESQNHYLSAWQSILTDRFYSAWCELDRAEVSLHFLARHFADPANAYGCAFLHAYVPRWQQLYPYSVFFSPGFIKQEIHCDICDARIAPRQSCIHERGELYDGQMAGRVIKKAKMLEVSLVTNPLQKYSVAWLRGSRYNYALVHYVASGLLSPWHRWEAQASTRLRRRPEFIGVKRNALCPCGSGKKFKHCHVDETTVELPHYDILFLDGVRAGLARLVADSTRYGVDDYAPTDSPS